MNLVEIINYDRVPASCKFIPFIKTADTSVVAPTPMGILTAEDAGDIAGDIPLQPL